MNIKVKRKVVRKEKHKIWSATMICKRFDLPRWFAKILICHDDLQKIDLPLQFAKKVICHNDLQKFYLPGRFAKHWSATMICKKIDLPQWFANFWSATMICKKLICRYDLQNRWSATKICKKNFCHNDLQEYWSATMICKILSAPLICKKFDLPWQFAKKVIWHHGTSTKRFGERNAKNDLRKVPQNVITAWNDKIKIC